MENPNYLSDFEDSGSLAPHVVGKYIIPGDHSSLPQSITSGLHSLSDHQVDHIIMRRPNLPNAIFNPPQEIRPGVQGLWSPRLYLKLGQNDGIGGYP